MVIKDNIVNFSLEKLFTDIQDQDDIPQFKFKRKSAKRSFTCDIADAMTVDESNHTEQPAEKCK
jgi:hypothetical protein